MPPLPSRRALALGLGLIAAVGALAWANRVGLRWFAIEQLQPTMPALARSLEAGPDFEGPDSSRLKLDVRLKTVAEGFTQPTDLQPVPGLPGLAVLTEKTGAAQWVNLGDGAHGAWFNVTVRTASEQGLLGLTFHPKFAENGRFFVHYVDRREGRDLSIVEEWRAPGQDPRAGAPKAERVVLSVEQPYQNHNAGQLLFGPDGMLYVAYGDGGYMGDPHGHGQDLGTYLGAMLRIDVDGAAPYAVPPDNPFVSTPGALPEIWAYGLRNPWRFSFDPKGRLIIADVGQNKWEEVSIAERGDNLGWKVLEGRACYDPETGCDKREKRPPIYVYGHDEGISITGGYVYTGAAVPALKGRYVFGDFGSGRLWALDLPAKAGDDAKVYALGAFGVHPSSFARDEAGELYLLDFGTGKVLQLVAP